MCDNTVEATRHALRPRHILDNTPGRNSWGVVMTWPNVTHHTKSLVFIEELHYKRKIDREQLKMISLISSRHI